MITLDSREGSGELLAFFPPGIAAIGHLEFADFAFLGKGPDGVPVTIGIERKAFLDLISSMTTGRFSGHQLPGLLTHYQVVYLLIEGLWRFNPKNGILERRRGKGWAAMELGSRRFMAREIWGFLNTLAVKSGVHLIQTSTRRETAQVIAALHHWWTDKSWDEHRSHLQRQQISSSVGAPLVKAGLLRRIASELPGIGWNKSLHVSKHFKSVLEMVMADEKEWMKVEGVGKKIAHEAVDVLGRSNK